MSNDEISETILKIATERGVDKTVCPSEIARALFPLGWRKYMDNVRSAAMELQKAGKVKITQSGQPVNPDKFKGPVRIKIIESVRKISD